MVDALSRLGPVLLKDKLVEHGEAELAKLCAAYIDDRRRSAVT
jgi:hypothetical protein